MCGEACLGDELLCLGGGGAGGREEEDGGGERAVFHAACVSCFLCAKPFWAPAKEGGKGGMGRASEVGHGWKLHEGAAVCPTCYIAQVPTR